LFILLSNARLNWYDELEILKRRISIDFVLFVFLLACASAVVIYLPCFRECVFSATLSCVERWEEALVSLACWKGSESSDTSSFCLRLSVKWKFILLGRS